MCGIAGIVSLKKASPELPRELQRMSTTIRHRGPDDEGFLFLNADGSLTCAWGDDTSSQVRNSSIPYKPAVSVSEHPSAVLGFAHRRLSILDLSPAGYQPMSYEDRYWITFNGEIYNYLELKSELLKEGISFRTATDTEVILAAFHHWGTRCFEKFNGMWALAIYDKVTQTITASRDRQGVKPFYYISNEEYFCFASEQKALARCSFYSPEVNTAEVFDFFILNRFEYSSEGFFKGIHELKPGCCLSLSLSLSPSPSLHIERYVPHTSLKEINVSDEQAIRSVAERLKDSVKLRLRSDVPVGSCLSGGIDSSAIVGLMRKLQPEQEIHVFTAAFPGLSIDESSYANQMAKHVRAVQHTVTPAASELIRDLDDLIYCQDIPIWSTSTYAQFRVMKLVAENGIKVILDGQGGDELFAGYHTYYFSYWQELIRKGRITQLIKELNKVKGSGSLALRSFVKDKLIPSLPSNLRMKVLTKLYPEFSYLNKDLIHENIHRLDYDKGSEPVLNEQLYKEFHDSRLKGYLKCEDRCAMWFSVESRVPFADDHNLSDLVFSLPSHQKIRNGVNKYVLRESIRDVVPSVIVDRKDKMGYVTPNNRWIKEIRSEVRDRFTENISPFINREKLLKEYDQLFSPSGDVDTGRVFKFLSFAIWMNHFFPRR